jgi:hypothetical protein
VSIDAWQQWPALACSDALHERVELGRQRDQHAALQQLAAQRTVDHGPTAQREYPARLLRDQLAQHLALELTECGLAALREQRRHRFAGALLDDGIEVEDVEAGACSHGFGYRGLAAAHRA